MKKLSIEIEKEFAQKFALSLEKNDVQNYTRKTGESGKIIFAFKATTQQAYTIGFDYSELLHEQE